MDTFQQFIEQAHILLEMPQYLDKDYELDPRELTQPDFYSDKTLSEQFKYIGTIDVKRETLELYIQEIHSTFCVIGVRSTYEHEKYKRCLLSIKLIELTNIDEKVKSLGSKCLAVSLVHCVADNRYSNISTNAYLMLANLGYVVVSDELHYKGAKALWKKLATIGLANVRVFDNDSDTFVTGSDNSEIYNGTNMPEEIIWGGSDKMNMLLVLSKT